MKKEYKEIVFEVILFNKKVSMDSSELYPEWKDDNVDNNGWV